MNLETLRLLFDFGLLILIWLVQLIIYPGFAYYSKEKLFVWHKKYTIGIATVVIPLMFGQLISATLQLSQESSLYTVGSMILIAAVWISTFVQFVPIHNQISKDEFDSVLLQKLVSRNWLRTFLWSIIFIFSVTKFI